jgi:diguanylate cyclase (GGDEF)-like protein/PAS domain S-box-containing protein
MRLKTRIFAFMSIVFVAFSAVIWLYSQTILEEINDEWTKRFVKKQVLFDKSRTLFPILKELTLVKELARNPHVINMALKPHDKKARQEGLKTIEKYKLKFQDRSYFLAFSKTKEYFFNNSTDDYTGKEMRYILSKDNPKDSWFFYTLSKNDPFQINVNKDKELGVTKVWIDYVVKVNNEKLAVLGTGFDFDEFLKNSVGVDQEGVKNFFFNKDLAIQLARETKLIDYSSMTHDGQHKNIMKFFKDEQDIALLRSLMKELYKNPEQIRTFWATFEGQKQLLGLAYLKKIGWFNLTVIDSKELSLINKSSVVFILSFILLGAFFSVGFTLNRLILTPIEKLKQMMKQIEDGDYTLHPQKVGHAEIAELSEQFITMVKYIQKNNAALEQTIEERTLNLQKSEEKLNTLLDSLEAYVFIKDTDLNYVYVNKKISEYFQKTKEQIIGRSDFEFFEKETAQEMRKNDRKSIVHRRKVTQEEIGCDLATKDVRVFLSTKMPLFDENEEVYALCGIATDITERKKTEELIKKLAFYDSLTGLPNRRMLKDRFDIILERLKRNPLYGAFMVIDLDYFKTINDKYGHQTGDNLLIEVANRLKSTLRSIDTVARYGGDEFIVLISDIAKEEQLAKDFVLGIADKILKVLNEPYELEVLNQNVIFTCSASIGVTVFNKDDDPEDIFQQADKAMYKIKNSTRNGVYL